MTKILTQSDIYAQIKPEALTTLEEKMEDASRFSRYPFRSVANYKPGEIWSINMLNFTIKDVYNLLKKSVKIVENTEEYTAYTLNKLFSESKKYSIPPGTLRFYSPTLVCFYNGKTWRKITP
jgi:hypothetical protein